MTPATSPHLELLVFGAHLAGEPLNHQLTDVGASFVAEVLTAPEYRMHLLGTVPPKPGVVRVGSGGTALPGELWAVPAPGLAAVLAALAPPLTIGWVRLAEGRRVLGFLCESIAAAGCPVIAAPGGWRAHLASAPRPPPGNDATERADYSAVRPVSGTSALPAR